ncbi:MAG TPA: glycosyltransferase family A protein [Gemmatimonadales bacterium]|nr:glycosyltransferase family A protein [Gemmatimonadales bacterium]
MRESRQDLISIVTPFLNPHPVYLREAIESVIAQTYSKWELLLVDDGSQGDSVALARDYARRDPERIRYLTHEGHQNRGHSASRNLAIREAKGEYVALLDADDLWLPRKLEEQLAIMSRHSDVGSVYGKTLYWFSWTGDPGDQSLDYVPSLGVPLNSVLPAPRFLANMVRGSVTVPCTCSLLVRRSLLDESGGFEPAFTSLFGDQVFYTKIFLGSPVYAASQCWDYYRRHPESLCATVSPANAIAARRRFLEWVRSYLLQAGIADGPVHGAVSRSLWELEHPLGARILRSGRRARRLGGRAAAWLRGREI